jgi:hypothetical protein
MPKIFVSYRREDSPGYAGRLYDRLHQEFGRDSVFIDVDTLQPGDDFVDAINDTLGQCDIVLAVIGPRWLAAEDEEHKPRLEDDLDFVRLEIQTALDRKIRVIPVLVERAKMPRTEELPTQLKGLARRQAIELSDTRWTYDVGRLVENLQAVSTRNRSAKPESAKASSIFAPPEQLVHPPEENLHAPVTENEPAIGKPTFVPTPIFTAPVFTDRRVIATQQRLVYIDYGNWVEKSLTISSDNRRVAYIEKKIGFLGFVTKYCVNVNGTLSAEYENAKIKITFSPDSSRVAYAVQKDNKWLVIIDGVEVGRYDDVGDPGTCIAFSPDSRRYTYLAKRDNKWLVVIDGKESRQNEGLLTGGAIFSPDSRRVAYGAYNNNKWTVVVDSEESIQYDAILDADFTFSPNSRRFAYGSRNGDKWSVTVDGVEGPRRDALAGDYFVFSPDSLRFAYCARFDNKWSVVIDEQEGERFDLIMKRPIVFSPDGRHYAYGAQSNGKWLLVRDGIKGTPCDALLKGGPVFSPDSQHLALGIQKNGQWFMVRDGQESPAYDDLAVNYLLFSPDSKHLAYGAKRRDKWTVVLDGKEIREHKDLANIFPVFSPDSQHLAYCARNDSGWVFSVNGQEANLYDGIAKGGQIVFDSKDSLHALAVKGPEVFRVDLSIR